MSDHWCRLPGFVQRRRYRVGPGYLWQCPECDTLWKWTRDRWGPFWKPEYRRSR